MTRHFAFAAFWVLLSSARPASCLTITSDAPGNIVVADSPIRFVVAGARDVVNYALNDYFGREILKGQGSVIHIPGLKPGWYELNGRDSQGTVRTTIGVVMDRGNAPLPADGRIGADTIGAGEGIARIIRRAGIPWVRERFWWSQIWWGEKGDFDNINWKYFPRQAKALSGEGIRVCQVWHDSPPWLHPKVWNALWPDDLRDVYRFSRAAAKQFAGRYPAWEVGNEVDSGAWNGMADRYAGYLKAAYLGLKDGNPDVLVLNGSLFWVMKQFAGRLYECGALNYLDVFNWHFYDVGSETANCLNGHLALLDRYHAANRPAWITEGGVPEPATAGKDKSLLDPEHQRTQCRNIPRNIILSLVAGNDRYFYFCLPSYLERGLQFGMLYPDTTPYPGFLSFSAVANILGTGDYLGEFKGSYVFSTPKGTVLAAWAPSAAELLVPTEKPKVRIADIFGAETDVAAVNGKVRVKIGPDPVYVLNIGRMIRSELKGAPRRKGRLPANKPSRIVIVGYSRLPIRGDPGDGICILGSGRSAAPFDFTVEAYNFDPKRSAEGTIDVAVPPDWQITQKHRTIGLDPMGRRVLSFRVIPAPSSRSGMANPKIFVRGKFGTENVAPSVSFFRYDSVPAAAKGNK
jgi:hypothetical protein